MPLEAAHSACVVYELQVIPFLSSLCIAKVSRKLSVLWCILTNNVIHSTKDGYHSMLVELIHVHVWRVGLPRHSPPQQDREGEKIRWKKLHGSRRKQFNKAKTKVAHAQAKR